MYNQCHLCNNSTGTILNDTHTNPPISQESIRNILVGIDEALSNLESLGYTISTPDTPNVRYGAGKLYRSDLMDFFMEVRNRLLAQLDTPDGTDINEDLSHETLRYTYQIEATRHGLGRSI